jgi:amino acid transporter
VIRRLPAWAILLFGTVVFVGCGIFLSLQDLGTATNYSNIASFLLALLTGIGSLLSLRRTKQENKPAQEGEKKQPRIWRSWMVAIGNGIVIHQGNNSTTNIANGQLPPEKDKSETRP